MIKAKAYAAQSASSPLTPFEIQRRDPGPEDVQIEILYCGVCHSDLHTARNEWKNTLYPSVPGHEIVGRVSAVGTRYAASRWVIWQALAAWWTAAGIARAAVTPKSNTASMALPEHTTARCSAAKIPTAAIPRVSWSRNPSSCTSGMTRRIWRASRRCCARASPPTHPCITGAPAPARRWGSSGLAASGTWA